MVFARIYPLIVSLLCSFSWCQDFSGLSSGRKCYIMFSGAFLQISLDGALLMAHKQVIHCQAVLSSTHQNNPASEVYLRIFFKLIPCTYVKICRILFNIYAEIFSNK